MKLSFLLTLLLAGQAVGQTKPPLTLGATKIGMDVSGDLVISVNGQPYKPLCTVHKDCPLELEKAFGITPAPAAQPAPPAKPHECILQPCTMCTPQEAQQQYDACKAAPGTDPGIVLPVVGSGPCPNDVCPIYPAAAAPAPLLPCQPNCRLVLACTKKKCAVYLRDSGQKVGSLAGIFRMSEK